MTLERINQHSEKLGTSLTELEITLLITLVNELYAEAGFSDVEVSDISRITKIDTKILRGVVSSLVQKKVIWIDEHTANFNPTDYFLVLTKEWYYIHERWFAEIS